jgi:S1-C subfamily serine protease
MIARVRPSVVRIDTSSGLGTGIIFEALPSENRTLVITNYHVIEGYSQVTVTVNDSTSHTGTVQGYDVDRDLAVVSIDGFEFQTLAFGDAENVPIGSEVVAVGYALGIPGSATVTRGIVSAVRYESDVDRWVIQTDAPINPGNSGGPLLSSAGEILGVNTYVVRSTGSGVPVEGFGFAVSEVTVQQELANLKEGSAAPFPTPTPLPQAPGGIYASDPYWYAIQIPSGWNLDASDDEAVVMWDPVTGATVWVQAEEMDPNVYPTLDSYVAEWHPAATASWTDFEIVDEQRVREGRIIQAHEWTYTYDRDGTSNTGRSQWYILGKYLVRVSAIATDAVWNMDTFVDARTKLENAQESFEPSAHISDQYGYSLTLPPTWEETSCGEGSDYCAYDPTGIGQMNVAIYSASGYASVEAYGNAHIVVDSDILDRSVLYTNRPNPSYRIDYERVAESGKTVKGAALITLAEGNAVWVFVNDYEENWGELSPLIDDIFLRVAVRQ